MSRYAFALGMLKSSSGHFFAIRTEMKNKNKDNTLQLIKEITERLRFATVRLYKLAASDQLLLVCHRLTREDSRAGQASPNTSLASPTSSRSSLIMKRLFELNFATLVSEKLVLEEPNTKTVDIQLNLAQRQIFAIGEIKTFFEHTPSDFSGQLVAALEISSAYFKAVAYNCVINKHVFMTDRLIDKTKEYEQIVVENNLLSHAILDLRDYFGQCIKSYQNDPQLVELAKHGISFVSEKIEARLKKYLLLRIDR